MQAHAEVLAVTTNALEGRVATLEAQVRALQNVLARLVAGHPIEKSDPRWVLATAGRFADDPVFAEVVRLGREWRESQRPDASQADESE